MLTSSPFPSEMLSYPLSSDANTDPSRDPRRDRSPLPVFPAKPLPAVVCTGCFLFLTWTIWFTACQSPRLVSAGYQPPNNHEIQERVWVLDTPNLCRFWRCLPFHFLKFFSAVRTLHSPRALLSRCPPVLSFVLPSGRALLNFLMLLFLLRF